MITRPTPAAALFAQLIAAVAAAACVLAFDYIPTHDGPQQIYTAHVAGHLDDAENGFATFMEHGFPVTAVGFYVPYRLTPPDWTWMARTKAALVFIVLLHGLAFSLLTRRALGRWTLIGALGFPLAFQWAFYMGFFPFLTSVSFGLLALAAHRTDAPVRSVANLGASALLLCAALAHIFPAAVVGLVVFALEALHGARVTDGAAQSNAAWLRAALRRSLIIGTPSLVVAALVALLVVVPHNVQPPVDWEGWVARITTFPRMYASGPAWRWAPVWVLPLIVIGQAVRRRARRTSADASQSALGFDLGRIGLVTCLIAFLAPLTAIGWQFFGPRFLALALPLCAIGAMASLTATNARRALDVAATIWVAASLTGTASRHATLEHLGAPLIEAASADLRRDGPRLAIILEPQLDEPVAPEDRRVPFGLSWMNASLIMATAQGGFGAGFYGFLPTMHPVVVVPHHESLHPPPPGTRYYEDFAAARSEQDALRLAALTSELAAAGAAWQDVTFFGPPDAVEQMLARGYTVDFISSNGSAAIARFEGCPARLVVPPDDEEVQLVMAVAWAPLIEPTSRHTFVLPARDAESTIPLPRPPCGAVRVSVFDDRDRSGSLSPGDRTCAGSTDGRFAFVNRPEGATIACAWQDAPPPTIEPPVR